jgi:UDP-glucose 4-epimerase
MQDVSLASPPLTGEIDRVVVIGHTGFIGSALMRRLCGYRAGLQVEGLSLARVDITTSAGAAGIASHLGPTTAVVMCAAIKRQLGDSAEIFQRNTAISVAFAEILAAHPVRRVVYLSSAAVYGEDVENLAITESTQLDCRTYYGLAKMTAEWLIAKAAVAHPAMSIGFVRPATIYGPGDLGSAYGPSGFLNATAEGRPIVFWGDGEERREFIYIDDVAEVLARYVFIDHRGPLNLVAGRSYTFADALAAATRICGLKTDVTSRPRSKAKVDNRFDNALLSRLMPDVAFTGLEAGMAAMFQARRSAAGATELKDGGLT